MSKVVQKESIDQLKEELQEIKSSKNRESKSSRLKEIAKSFASNKQWDLTLETFQLVENERDRDILIADLVEEFLLPSQEITQAKRFAKYIVQEQEVQPLILIRIALAENDREQAQKIAKNITSPLARNFAFLHIIESYLFNNQKDKAQEVCKLILENARTIYDSKVRSYILREIAVDLYFANHEKVLAKEAALLIPDETIKTQVLNKIGITPPNA